MPFLTSSSLALHATPIVRHYPLLLIAFAMLGLAGCPWSGSQPNAAATSDRPAHTGPLRVAVVDDLPLADVIEREWQARTESETEIIRQSTETLLADNESSLEADVVIFPSAMLGHLAQHKLIRQLPSTLLDQPDYQKLEIFDQLRRREMQWKGRPYAVSFGSPPIVLLVRADIADESVLTGTWTELAALARSTGEAPAASAEFTGLVQPLGQGWAGKILLVRAAPYLFHRSRVSTLFDFRTLAPQIGSPPFVRALEELIADFRTGPPEAIDFGPAEALEHFLAGNSVAAMTWPSAVAEVPGNATPATFPISVRDVPGSIDRFDMQAKSWVARDDNISQPVTVLGLAGRLGSLARGARNLPLATTFLGWATGPEYSDMISSRSGATTLSRRSHVKQPESWVDPRISAAAAAQYAAVVEIGLGRNQVIMAPRLPGQDRYMRALDEAVRKALRDELPASEALKQAASQWDEISESIGRDDQLSAYRRSLGIAEN